MTDKPITFGSAKLFISFGASLVVLSGTFFSGIEIAKSHADEKVKELKQETNKNMEEMTVLLKEIYDKVAEQKQDVEVIKVIIEERSKKKS